MDSPRFTRWLTTLGAAALPAGVALLTSLIVTAPAGAEDSSWPRQFESSSGSFVIYQPQPEDLQGDLLTGRAAFSLQRGGGDNPTFGVLWFTARIVIDRDSSTVDMRDLDVTKVRLPGITAAEESRYEKLVETEAARWDLSGSFDELKAGLASAEKERASVDGLDNTPPRIVFRYERSILVLYDGAPVLEPIEGSKLERVANTPYAVVFDPTSRLYYLSGADLWYRAKDPLGPWTTIPAPPARVQAVVPPDTSSEDRSRGTPPRVFTATEPTELIAIDGTPKYAPLVDDELLYVTNTESDVVREVSTQAIYVLLAGRWYRAPSTEGPWSFVRGDQLPASFGKVPPDSPKGHILASVAGTDQADDALADAEIPQTSAIRRGEADFDVVYDGPPQFEPIEGTNLEYAVNTDAEVILADGRYYACDQGVWYVSDHPNGPWMVSETRPIGVEDIPPSCPVYDVRYVYVYDVTPEVIYVGYLPGYLGCYPYYGTVVYGTGYHYRPWRRHRYYPRPCTWGYFPRYNPWLSRWSFGYSYGSGFLRVGYRWRPEVRSTHHHGPPRWFGPGGFRRPLLASDRSPLRTWRPRQAPLRPMERTPMNLYRRPQNMGRIDAAASRLPVRPVARPAPRALPRPNDMFAGRDGKVYQRDTRGNWRVNEGRIWKPARVPDTPRAAPRPSDGGGSAPGSMRSVIRPRTQPAPAAPAEPRNEPRSEPRIGQRVRPAPPVISPTPGNLEREFRGRERAREGGRVRVSAPEPQATPAPQERKQERPSSGRKR